MTAPREPLESAASAALAHFGLPGASREWLGNAGGFSGSELWRVATPKGDWCLKAWPPHPRSSNRIPVIHHWMHSARVAGLRFVPELARAVDGETWEYSANRGWELAPWMPGKADFKSRPSRARLWAAVEAVAALHLVWYRGFGQHGPCAAVGRRLHVLDGWLELVRSGWQPEFRPDDPAAESTERAWRLLPSLISELPAKLKPWLDEPLRLHPCLGDVWHDHVLFQGDEVTGIIDYGAARIDTPAVDLARLLGSLAGSDETLFDDGLRHYQTMIALSKDETALVRLLDWSGAILGMANWIRWLYFDNRQIDRNSAAMRLTTLMTRLLSL